jgi:hypothetical protein
MASRITVRSILRDLPDAFNPFDAIRDALRRELYSNISRPMRIAVSVFLGLLSS